MASTTNPDDVKFYTYTAPNQIGQPVQIIYNNVDSLAGKVYCSKPTICLVHGLGPNGTASPPAFPGNVREVYLAKYNTSHNIISVDWLKAATVFCGSGVDVKVCLLEVVASLETIGKRVAEFFVWLHDHDTCNLDFGMVHIVAHSMGCPVAGYAGKYTKDKTGKMIQRITALDHVSLVLQGGVIISRPLHPDDAICTDGHHTSAVLGTVLPVGKCDFYINPGVVQPGCINTLNANDPTAIEFCNHHKSTEYWIESIFTDPHTEICVCNSPLVLNPACCDAKMPYGEHNNCAYGQVSFDHFSAFSSIYMQGINCWICIWVCIIVVTVRIRLNIRSHEPIFEDSAQQSVRPFM